MSDPRVLLDPADIEARIEGTTVCHWLARAADQFGRQPAISARVHGRWQTRTWGLLRQEVLEAAAGFIGLGLQQGETVAILSSHRPEQIIAALGVIHAGGVPVVLEGHDQPSRWLPTLDQLPPPTWVVLIDQREGLETAVADARVTHWAELITLGRMQLDVDPSVAEDRWRDVDPYDPLALIYCPGPEGTPVSIERTHHDVLYAVEETVATSAPHLGTVTVAAIGGDALGICLPIRLAGAAYLCLDPAQLVACR